MGKDAAESQGRGGGRSVFLHTSSMYWVSTHTLCACCYSYLLYRELAIPPLLVRLRHVWFRQSGRVSRQAQPAQQRRDGLEAGCRARVGPAGELRLEEQQRLYPNRTSRNHASTSCGSPHLGTDLGRSRLAQLALLLVENARKVRVEEVACRSRRVEGDLVKKNVEPAGTLRAGEPTERVPEGFEGRFHEFGALRAGEPVGSGGIGHVHRDLGRAKCASPPDSNYYYHTPASGGGGRLQRPCPYHGHALTCCTSGHSSARKGLVTPHQVLAASHWQ